ncbi:MAG TPA: glycosyltransferase, partial [Microlunatus sp.]|nr:glycosyltransferase [Microlunatus sp.]
MERSAGEARPVPTTPARVRRARLGPEATMRGWASGLEPMTTETRWSRTWSHLGILISITALLIYVTWRIVFTLPPVGWNLVAAWLLIAFEAFPVIGLIIRAVTLWNLDTRVPAPVTTVGPGHRAAVFIPTYNEPVEVIAPTIAAACALEPAHHTWVLDDGDRPWVAELCEAVGARYVRRPEHTHAKAGNMNHALELMAREIED